MIDIWILLLSLPADSLPAEAAVLALLGKLLLLLMCMNVKLLNAVVLENIPLEILSADFKFSALSIVFYFCQDRLRVPKGKQLNHSPAGVWLKPHCFEIELITQDLSCVAYCKIGSL